MHITCTHFLSPSLSLLGYMLSLSLTHTYTHTHNTDILEGNSKGIMRVILALAERYQPRSVKQRSVSDPKPYIVAQQHASPVHYNQRDHTPPDRFSSAWGGGGGDHMTSAAEHPPPIASRTRSPDEIRPRAQNLKSFSSLAAANSFSVPNMASLNVHAHSSRSRGGAPVPIPPVSSSTRPVPGRRSYDQTNMPHAQGYGPPQIGQGALSQPERLMKSTQNEDMVQTHTYSLSQADMENEVYSTPVDQLPPSAGTRIIAPQKKLGMPLINLCSEVTANSVLIKGNILRSHINEGMLHVYMYIF